jgi:hypothetical protein
MQDTDQIANCDFCGRGTVLKAVEELSFRQWTPRGYVSCRVDIPIGTCNYCGARGWDKRSEAIIEQTVSREIEKIS